MKFMISDRGPELHRAFDAVLADAGIRTVRCTVRTPRMNAIAERWIGGCRRELLDRTLIWNQGHLRQILRDYETHYNQHRPHRFLHGAAPLRELPHPLEADRIETPRHTPTRPSRRSDPRVPTCRLTCAEEVFGTHRHTFVQNLRRGHYELAADVPARHRIRRAFDQLVVTI